MSILGQIIKSKSDYLHLLIGIIICIILLLFLWYINIFLYWMQFGEGADSSAKYHELAVMIYEIYPALLVILVCFLQLYKNYRMGRFDYAKSYLFIAILAPMLSVFQNDILNFILGS